MFSDEVCSDIGFPETDLWGSWLIPVSLNDREGSRMVPLGDHGIPQEFFLFLDPSLVCVGVTTILSSLSWCVIPNLVITA